MHHNSRLDRLQPEIGAIITIGGSRIIVGDVLVVALEDGSVMECVVAFGLGRLVVSAGDPQFEMRPWHKGDGMAPVIEGPSSTWTISGMPNHTH